MRRRGPALLLAAGLLAAAPVAFPQAETAGTELPAVLTADSVTYDRETKQLVAAGDVEVLYQGRVLRATRIVYDERADSIRAEGPLTLTDPDGGVLFADSAALTPDLEEGLVSSARLLIDGQLQLAAAEVRRTGGRYATLQRTIASSCTICEGSSTPTWAIRASRVTEDTVARRLYFENARLEAFGVPIALVPRLSIPEPGVARASGVLPPDFQQSDIYGFGFKLPYYRVLGSSSDATVTPFVTTEGGFLLEGEYRQRFSNGGFDVWGVIGLADTLDEDGASHNGAGRGAVSAVGVFGLPHDFVLDFDLNMATDKSFLTQYDYTDADQLTSVARVSRTRESDYFEISTVAFQSLTNEDDDVDVPFVFPELYYRRLVETPGIGGRLGIDINSLGVWRHEGSMMLRGGGAIDWNRDWHLPKGIRGTTTASTLVDLYRVWDNPDVPDSYETQVVPAAAVELRWPFVRSDGGGASHVIEPIGQVVWSTTVHEQQNIPNEDSRLPEFDETNLFSLNRFPGLDRSETGLRANLGISYTRYDPAGWSMGLTLGRVVRDTAIDEFAEGTGLAGRWSDWIGAVSLELPWGLGLVNRALFDPDLDFRRNEFALVYDGDFGAMRAAYTYLAEDDSNPILGPQPEINEFALDARVRVHRNWELRGIWRYDVATNSNLRAGAGISYGNECAEFDLSVSRRYTTSSSVPPSTSIGFAVRLSGIGHEGEERWPARVCTPRGT
jgi:LPS-assembly protein